MELVFGSEERCGGDVVGAEERFLFPLFFAGDFRKSLLDLRAKLADAQSAEHTGDGSRPEVSFVVAAVITPPDVISQVMLAMVLIFLYEISIFSVRLIEKDRGHTEDDFGDEDTEEQADATSGA